MRTIKFNGEFWYEDCTPLLARLATWLIWVGGGSLRSPAPVSLLGHRVTFFGWGAQLRLPGGDLLTVSWPGVDPKLAWRSKPAAIYVSRDGTPQNAHIWLVGEPHEVREAVRKVGRRRASGNWRAEARS